MLSRLGLQDPFRSLVPQTFTQEAVFGKRTVVYGHNGSGKSSLAELLYQLSEGRCSNVVSWTDASGSRTQVARNAIPQQAVLSVFTKSWVQANLAGFLDGDSAASIVTLGSAAVDAKARQTDLEDNLQKLREDEPAARKRHATAQKATKALVSSVQDSIEGALREVDNREYTKNRYNDPKVRQLLAVADQTYADAATHAQNLDEVARGALPAINLSPPTLTDWPTLIEEVGQLLERGVGSQLIEELLGKGELQAWLEDGLKLHEDVLSCLFCEGVLPKARIDALRRHFDESRKQLQADVDLLTSRITRVRSSLDDWVEKIPGAPAVYGDLHEELAAARIKEEACTNSARQFLSDIESLLAQKREAPERTSFPDLPESPDAVGHAITEITARHDKIASEAEERQATTARAILAYLVGSQSKAYQDLHKTEASEREEHRRLVSEIDRDEQLLKEAKAEQYSSNEMARQITRDLASIYGKAHLTIEVSDDGQSYLCRREGQPAEHLSEGERNTLALIYFLRLLEDESTQILPANRVVVVDDPSSSFDREAVFATHSRLLDALPLYGQSIILTHDFEMLRLLLASQSNQLNNHRGVLRGLSSTDASRKAAAQKEKCFPRISFLEMRSTRDGSGQRSSVLAPISKVLLDHNSEYHFLFDRVLAGLEDPNDHATLFLLPNAARRLLETFASFHAPDRPNFLDQITKLAIEDRNAEFRDVYDFCNRFSHGEGRETQVVLDVHTTQQQLRRCIEFLRAVNADHYADMCRATGRKDHDPLDAPAIPMPCSENTSRIGSTPNRPSYSRT